jgi:hypothetical protein
MLSRKDGRRFLSLFSSSSCLFACLLLSINQTKFGPSPSSLRRLFFRALLTLHPLFYVEFGFSGFVFPFNQYFTFSSMPTQQMKAGKKEERAHNR